MQYDIHCVADDELPEGYHVVLVERDDASTLMLLSGEPARVWAMMRAYESTQESCAVPSILEPLRLVV